MAVAVDYYELLSIPRDANDDAVKDAVKKGMRLWRKKTEASDLSVRQEAELQVKLIEEARGVLTDPAKRSAYDQRLAREGVAPAVQATPDQSAGQDWLAEAKAHLARGDYRSAAYAAREATAATGNSSEAWFVQSRANAGLNRLDNALYEANRAVELDSRNPWFQFHKGAVAEEMGLWDQAMGSYQDAARMEPTENAFRLAIAGVFLQNGLPERALPEAEKAYQHDPNDENACYYLGATLLELAERVPAKRLDDMYLVSSPSEIEQMESLVSRVRSLRHQPDEIRANADAITEYLERMKKKAFRAPFGGGCNIILPMILVPLFFIFSGFAMMSVPEMVGTGFIFLLIGGLVIFGLYKWCWVPAWKINAKTYI